MTSTVVEHASSNGVRKTYPAEYKAALKQQMRHRERSGGGWVDVPITDADVDFLMMKAAAYKLDPLKGQIYATWRNGAIQVGTTFDGLRALAERTGEYQGQTPPQWYDEKEKKWTDIWLSSDPPAAAR
ncbi:MAG TPA: recombinase RecT, partial [Solirubrobacterales bacterium]